MTTYPTIDERIADIERKVAALEAAVTPERIYEAFHQGDAAERHRLRNVTGFVGGEHIEVSVPSGTEDDPSPSMDVHYDADSMLPLGWSWRDVQWPSLGCTDLTLQTACGPDGEMLARSPSGRWYKIGITDRHDGIWAALEKAIVAAEQVRAKR